MNKIAAISLFVAVIQGAFVFTACASSYEENTGTIDLTSMTVSGSGITVSGNMVEITEGGDFTVTGENTNGMIYVNTTDKVKLRLSGMGDADVGTSVFNMTGGTLTGNNGDMFYITNTHSLIDLSGVDIENKDTEGYFMRVSGNSASRGWGKAGENGAQVEFTADDQKIDGDIIVDTISTLDMELVNGSEFNGTINIIDNEQNGTAVDNNAVITVDEDSVWNLTGDCTVTSVENNGTINFNGYTITLADGTVLSE